MDNLTMEEVTSDSSCDFARCWTVALQVTLLGLISAVGTFSNSLVILAIFLYDELRTKAKSFVCNLAVADLILCLFVIPLRTMMMFARQPFGLCHVTVVAQATFVYTSINTLAAISYNRFVLTMKTRSQYENTFTKRNVFLILSTVWCLAFGASFMAVMWTGALNVTYDNKTRACVFLRGNATISALLMVPLSLLFSPLLLTLYFYARIFYYARHSAVSVTGHRPDDISFTYKLCCITILFGILNFPACILAVVQVFSSPDANEVLIRFSIIIQLLNSAVNPVIYGWKVPKFRNAFIRMLRLNTCFKRAAVQPINH
ncbi:adenosine receptor A3-like [Argonauta hians]